MSTRNRVTKILSEKLYCEFEFNSAFQSRIFFIRFRICNKHVQEQALGDILWFLRVRMSPNLARGKIQWNGSRRVEHRRGVVRNKLFQTALR